MDKDLGDEVWKLYNAQPRRIKQIAKGFARQHNVKRQEVIKYLEERKRGNKRKIVTGVGVGFLLAVLGLGRGYFFDRTEVAESQEKATTASSLETLWDKEYIEEGIPLNEDVYERYSLFRENRRANHLPEAERDVIQSKIVKLANEDTEKFMQNAIPDNYTPAVLLQWVNIIKGYEPLLNPGKVSSVFGLDKNHLLYKELKANLPKDKTELVKKILRCSLMITKQRLNYNHNVQDAEDFESFIKNIKNKEGKCLEYTYSAANIYYSLCDLVKRPDLVSGIRIVIGVRVFEDGRVDREVAHSWIEFNEGGRWYSIEPTLDNINEDTPISLSMPALYYAKTRGGCFLNLLSTKVEFDGKPSVGYYVHILPKETKTCAYSNKP